MVTGIHHVGVAVRDLERSIAWYRAVFGFSVVGRGEFDGAPLAFLSLGGTLLELVQEFSHDGPGPVNHFALAVHDLDAELARLGALGVIPWPPGVQSIWNGGRVAFVPGPDGEEIELIELQRKQSD